MVHTFKKNYSILAHSPEQATSTAKQLQNIFTMAMECLHTPSILSLADAAPLLREEGFFIYFRRSRSRNFVEEACEDERDQGFTYFSGT